MDNNKTLILQRIISIALVILFLFSPVHLLSSTTTIRIPLAIDYSLMRSLLMEQTYTKPGGRAVPLEMDEGCTKIELWDPDIGSEKSFLKIGSNMKLSIGLPIGKTCLKLTEWDGRIDILQHLFIDPQTMRLKLEAFDLRALTTDGKKTFFDQKITNLLTTYLTPFFSQIGIDLSEPIKGLKGLLPLFFSPQDQPRIQSWLSTVKPGQIKITPEGINLDIFMDVEAEQKKEQKDVAGSPSVMANLIKSWENIDAYAVHQIETLFDNLITDSEKENILETLLDTRYEFIHSLNEGTLDVSLLGNHFASIWQAFSPVLKKYLSKSTERSPLSFLTFITVSDALSGLVKVGSDISMIPSRDGLLRLAKLLSIKQIEPTLDYSYALRPDLRSFLGFGNPLDDTGPAYNGFEIDVLNEQTGGVAHYRLLSSLKNWPSLLFAEENPPLLQEILPWVMPKGDISPYLEKIKLALTNVANEIVLKKKLDAKYHPFFRQMSLATAWQESVWQQFIGSGNKIKCLVSYNQSSVGLMQINERVWRGIYRPESLRWNVVYNIQAGCEILEEYLRRYALKKPEAKTMDSDTLAQTLYAMYNGGPGQFKKFLLRKKENKLYKSDTLFWQKYSWVKSNQLDKIKLSLGR